MLLVSHLEQLVDEHIDIACAVEFYFVLQLFFLELLKQNHRLALVDILDDGVLELLLAGDLENLIHLLLFLGHTPALQVEVVVVFGVFDGLQNLSTELREVVVVVGNLEELNSRDFTVNDRRCELFLLLIHLLEILLLLLIIAKLLPHGADLLVDVQNHVLVLQFLADLGMSFSQRMDLSRSSDDVASHAYLLL